MEMDDVSPPLIVMDKAVMSETYVPERLIGREDQVRDIMRCLAPALKNRRPLHLWLHGKSGSGKTVTTSHVLRRLQDKAGIKSVSINCWSQDSYFSVLDEIVFQLRIVKAEQHCTSVKLHRLGRYLADRPFVIVLDEVDKLRPCERSATLYNLDQLDNVGIVCIADTRQAFFDLEERIRSRLNPYHTHFPSYTRKDLKTILAHRAQLALPPETWSDTLLGEVADMAAGNARIAIRALKSIAELAESDRSHKLSQRFMRKQWEEAKLAQRAAILKRLTEDHRILYDIVREQKQILSGNLWQRYLLRCDERRRKPLALRTFSEYANRLVQTGLITAERARIKGRVRLFKVAG